ncbi:hypothetical protein [Clostridium sp. BJN0001]|uniref:hypothetical protein n=1 Tax=Clostridium sp. BJN0001 TaxID=2930219 RepID=UPI001FCF8889|nr:hypothetical protein [Clostridium sp. BJN0001]
MNQILIDIFHSLLLSLIILTELFGILIICGLILGYIRNKSIKNLLSSVGFTAIILTAPGVIIHELSHYIFAKIFLYNVNEVKLIRPFKGSKDGILGYVNFSYNKNNIIQKAGLFLTGFAPIICGTLTLFISMKFLVNDTYNSLITDIKNIISSNSNILSIDFLNLQIQVYKKLFISLFTFQNIHNTLFYIFIYIAICISAHIALSKADLESSITGIITIFLLIFIIVIAKNIINIDLFTYINKLKIYNIFFSTLLFIEIFFSILFFIITYIFRLINSLIFRK